MGAHVLYQVGCPARAIKGKLSESCLLIGPASCTRARRVHSAAPGAGDLGEGERAGRERLRMNGDNGKAPKKVRGRGINAVRTIKPTILINFCLKNTERPDFVEGWTSYSAPALQTLVHTTSVNGRDLCSGPLPNRLIQAACQWPPSSF